MAAEASLVKQYHEYTRYIRAVRQIKYEDREMLSTLLQYLEPDDIASCSQLLGDRKGVVRLTFRSRAGVKKLEELIQKRKLQINTVPLGMVDEHGAFIICTLENVPQVVSDDQIEDEMQKYGTVAGSSRDYVEFKGRRIETERRRVLFTALYEKQAIPKELKLFGTTIFTKYKGQDSCGICREHGSGEHHHDHGNGNGCSMRRTPSTGTDDDVAKGRFIGRQDKRNSAMDIINRTPNLE